MPARDNFIQPDCVSRTAMIKWDIETELRDMSLFINGEWLYTADAHVHTFPDKIAEKAVGKRVFRAEAVRPFQNPDQRNGRCKNLFHHENAV